jgi:predicted transport protein
VIPQKGRLRIVLPLDPNHHSDHPLTRDISEVGHWGVGDMEATLASEDQLEQVIAWTREAADAVRGMPPI